MLCQLTAYNTSLIQKQVMQLMTDAIIIIEGVKNRLSGLTNNNYSWFRLNNPQSTCIIIIITTQPLNFSIEFPWLCEGVRGRAVEQHFCSFDLKQPPVKWTTILL